MLKIPEVCDLFLYILKRESIMRVFEVKSRKYMIEVNIMKKAVAMMMTAAMGMAVLAGCGSSSSAAPASSAVSEAPASSAASEAGSAVSEVSAASEASAAETTGEYKLAADGVLTMGTNAAFPPYEYYDGETIVGIDAEISQAIADKLGLTLEIVDMDFGSLTAAVQSGKVDIAAAGMTVTEERLQNVDFTDSYSTGVQVVIVPEDSDIASIDDLEGKLIGVQDATTGHIYCSDDFGEENVVAYNNGAMAVQALKDGKVDCVVIDQEPAKNFVQLNEGLKILETEYVTEDYAIAVAKDNTALKDAINAAMAELKEDGTIQGILDKYITAE